MVSTKASGLAVVAIVVFAFGLAGTQAIGLHKECTDGIDNDNDFDPLFPPEFGMDAYDSNCMEYPYEDGNGESSTPSNQRFGSIGVSYQINGYATAFDWVLTQYELNPHPLNAITGALPLCHQPGTQPGMFQTWISYPTIEGSQAAYTQHSIECPP